MFEIINNQEKLYIHVNFNYLLSCYGGFYLMSGHLDMIRVID